ncbi:uncharacterized protein [Macrobrachium rosenbergii]|uniref:uncharacterized protein n=1 Tax=Macrobrachium rosenbergii TaxID=79674 RepID=UPI0034D700D1
MCIIKDIILNRCKAFNTSQLLMFMNEVFDLYMKQRLLDVALGRKKSRVPAYNSISQDIIRCNDDEYKMFVKSQSEDTVTYTVDLRLGICDCTMGNTGKVCKHQVACSEKFLLALPQIFSSTPEKRQWLARIALGNENVPSLEFFATLHDNSEQFQSDCVKECDKNTQATAYRHNEDSDGTQMPSTTFQHNNTNSDDTQMPSTVHCNNKNKFEKSTDSDDDDCKTSNPKRRSKQIMEKLDILTETIKHSAALYGDELTVGDIEKLTNRFRNVRTSDQLHSLFQCTGAALPCVGRGKIPCQPTSIARRQQGMPRGAAPITKGRKRKGNLIHKTLKRQRNLSLNISQNVMNAKSHGSDH